MPLVLLHFLAILSKTNKANDITERINKFKGINCQYKTMQTCLPCLDNLLKTDSSLESYSPKQIKNQSY